jgi:hypothetical protein
VAYKVDRRSADPQLSPDAATRDVFKSGIPLPSYIVFHRSSSMRLAAAFPQPYMRQVSEKLKALLTRYGRVAMITYFAIFALVYAGFYAAIAAGVQPEGVGAGVGTLGGAYLATKLTQPIRIGATLLLTPIIDALVRRFRPPQDVPSTDT